MKKFLFLLAALVIILAVGQSNKLLPQINLEKYFTFLNHPSIPIDNNTAERALRHLVIKRKISFGSKTQRGAETTGILASVILSLKWNNPESWFQKYLQLAPQKTA